MVIHLFFYPPFAAPSSEGERSKKAPEGGGGMDTAIGHRAMDGPFGRPRPLAFRAQGICGNGGGFLWFVSFGGKRNEQKFINFLEI